MGEGGRHSQARWWSSRRVKPEASAATRAHKGRNRQEIDRSAGGRHHTTPAHPRWIDGRPIVAECAVRRLRRTVVDGTDEGALVGGTTPPRRGRDIDPGAVTVPDIESPQRCRERTYRGSNVSKRPDSGSEHGSAADRDDFPGSRGVRAGPRPFFRSGGGTEPTRIKAACANQAPGNVGFVTGGGSVEREVSGSPEAHDRNRLIDLAHGERHEGQAG